MYLRRPRREAALQQLTRGAPGQITYIHGDGTYDVRFLDGAREPEVWRHGRSLHAASILYAAAAFW